MSKVFKVEVSEQVEAPPEVAYGVVTDLMSYPEFLPWVKRVSHGDGVVEMEMQAGPLTFVLKQTVAFEPDRAVAFRQIEGPFRYFIGGWTFSPTDQGTRVSYSMEFDLHLPLPGMDRVLCQQLRNNVATIMSAFKKRLAEVMKNGGKVRSAHSDGLSTI